MLHDIGHGPFSHAFEEARKEIARLRSETNPIEKHEAFSGKMIEDSSGEIGSILDDAGVNPQDVARLIQKETPEDMYHAIVSSSFDADRLDYLMRDRYMTGTGAGAIDLEWLMDNVRVASLDFSLPDGTETAPIHRSSFCLLFKARDAAEDFLLARYRLYANVYFHKTTRGIEQLLSAFFRVLAVHLDAGQQVVGLSAEHPLIRFFARDGGDLTTYRLLDDTVVWGALHTLAHSGAGEIKELAYRVLFREKPYCVDLQNEFPGDDEKQRRLKNRITKSFENTLGKRVFQDIARLSIYGEIGADDDRAQKRLLILPRHGEPQEITKFEHSTIASEKRPRLFERFYFLDKADYTAACGHVDSVRIGNAGRNT